MPMRPAAQRTIIQKLSVRSSPVTGENLSPRTPEVGAFLAPSTSDTKPPFLDPSTPDRYLLELLLEVVLEPVSGVLGVSGVLELLVVSLLEELVVLVELLEVVLLEELELLESLCSS